MNAYWGWLYPKQQFPTKALILLTAILSQWVFYRKLAFVNDKGKENIEYFLALSGETAEFSITICF
jgi:hypothetical protein